MRPCDYPKITAKHIQRYFKAYEAGDLSKMAFHEKMIEHFQELQEDEMNKLSEQHDKMVQQHDKMMQHHDKMMQHHDKLMKQHDKIMEKYDEIKWCEIEIDQERSDDEYTDAELIEMGLEPIKKGSKSTGVDLENDNDDFVPKKKIKKVLLCVIDSE